MDRGAAFKALTEPDPDRKVMLTRAAQDSADVTGTAAALVANAPGRPARPLLIHPARVPRRRAGSPAGRAALIHAIAHIEFNAINLALDAICRFGAMQQDYYTDWMQVAVEEAHHFSLLREHLRGIGHDYGDFDAHDGLWETAEKTRDDLLARLALVPRTLEARGLDASPAVRAKLHAAGDLRGAAIIDIILADEIGHVAIGNRWYRRLCDERGIDPIQTYALLAERYQAARLHGPFNLAARRAAGFTEAELALLGV